MAMKTFKQRIEALEALEAARRPEAPPFLCVRREDVDRLDDPATLARYGIPPDAELPPKIYVDMCICAWSDDGRTCPVCEGEQLC